VPGHAEGPIWPLEIDYEGAFEEEIAEAVAELEQIGDFVGGHVSIDEILFLLRLLR